MRRLPGFVLLCCCWAALAEDPFDAQRAIADKQATNPAVVAYRARIASDLDAALRNAFLHCSRRELYSRRAYPVLVLTIDANGTVTRAEAQTVNRMGLCGMNDVPGIKLAPPPVAPLNIVM